MGREGGKKVTEERCAAMTYENEYYYKGVKSE